MENSQIINKVEQLANASRPVYLVGGAVRDRFLGRASHDLDFVMPGETGKLARRVADALNADFFVLDAERDTSRVIYNPQNGERIFLDFASLRSNDLDGDLRARDFSINAMAYRLGDGDKLIDPCGGLPDLQRKTLRACGPDSLAKDPVRVLRAVRLAVGLGFQIDEQTIELARAAAALLPRISAERQRDELSRMLEGSQTSLCVRLLERLGGLEYVLPDLIPLKGLKQPVPHVLDAWEHTLEVIDHIESLVGALARKDAENSDSNWILGSAVLGLGRFRNEFNRHLAQPLPNGRGLIGLLKLAALYHDTGKATTGSTGKDGRLHFYGHEDVSARLLSARTRALAYSNEEVEHGVVIVREHMRVHSLCAAGAVPTKRAIYHFFRDAGDAGVEVCLLSLADTWATYSHTLTQEHWLEEINPCQSLLEAYWENKNEVISPPRLINGHELIVALGLQPGRLVGLILDAIRESQAVGDIRSKEEALAFARAWLVKQEDDLDDESKR